MKSEYDRILIVDKANENIIKTINKIEDEVTMNI